jgi:hypothetical protein
MKTTFGAILLILGLIATVITGISVIEKTQANILPGLDILATSGKYLPPLLSIIILSVGILSLTLARGK